MCFPEVSGQAWLNMIEIEFSALSRQCLNRRISSIRELSNEVITYFKEHSDNNSPYKKYKLKIDLSSHLSKINKILDNRMFHIKI